MSKVLAVFGATGQQGGSVISHVLGDSELSKEYKIRAITRNTNSEKAKQLKSRSVEVVEGDVVDRSSLEAALAGVHTVFAMTMFGFGPDSLEVEYNNAKTIADVAVEKGAKYIIFSSLPPVQKNSNGKYTKVNPFDAKAKAEDYIRNLPIKSAFFAPASFMENYRPPNLLGLRQSTDGSWVWSTHVSPSAKIPLINATGDSGKFVGAILADPEKYEGKTLCAATKLYSVGDIAAILSKHTGKTILYKQVSSEEFRDSIPMPAIADMMMEAFSYMEEFGYYGPETEALVKWAASTARGRLSTFEECLDANPLQF